MLANSDDSVISGNIEKEGIRETFSIGVIIQKRLRLLKLLEKYIEEGNLKAIELYCKLLNDIRDDLRSKDDGNFVNALKELIEDD